MPIVEPEVLMDADNTIERCYDVTLADAEVDVPRAPRPAGRPPRRAAEAEHGHLRARAAPSRRPASQIAELTLRCFMTHVPAAVPGIVFLSGGQSEVEATENLNAINQIGGPWPLSFSYGRALQASALEAWGGNPASVEAAQAAFVHRARMNALAAAGEWNAQLEQPVVV